MGTHVVSPVNLVHGRLGHNHAVEVHVGPFPDVVLVQWSPQGQFRLWYIYKQIIFVI